MVVNAAGSITAVRHGLPSNGARLRKPPQHHVSALKLVVEELECLQVSPARNVVLDVRQPCT